MAEHDYGPSATEEEIRDLSPIVEQTALQAELSRQMATSTKVWVNVKQDIFAVTADRVRLRLREYEDAQRARAAWQTPAGILAGLIAALVASDFKDTLGLKSHVWKAVFLLGALLCFGFLVRALIRAWRFRHHGDTIETLVERLRE